MPHQWYTSGRPLTPARPTDPSGHDGRSHIHQFTRRRFIQTSAGAAALGAVVGSGLLRPGAVQAAGPGIGLAEPIPATFEFFPGVFSHVEFPPVLIDENSDPGTVFNFQGTVGAALISGRCMQRNRRTGETRTLPYSMNDMRFQKGVFRGRDGHTRGATFALV